MTSYKRAPWGGKIAAVLAMSAVLVTLGCKDLDVPNYTNADSDLLNANPDASVVNLMSAGLLRSIRSGAENLETYGRNAYNLDPTEVRSVTVPLIGPIASGSYWPYSDIRNAYSILHALDKVPSAAVSPTTGLTDAQKAGIRGFVKTMMAFHYHAMLRVRYQLGGFIDVDRDQFGPLAPWVNGKAVLDHIISMLDDAQTDLNAAGTAFSFTFTRGFQAAQGGAAFNTPATFRLFNRALKARVEVYAATWDTPNATTHWNNALAALSASFISPTTVPAAGPSPAITLAALDVGPKHTYGPSTADGLNTLLDATGRQRFVHPSVMSDAQLNGTTIDNRVTRKSIDMGVFKGILGLSSRYRWNIAGTGSGTAGTGASDTPIPIIRNEELILLRAEANLGLGNTSLAIRDINLVRVNSGLLPQISDPYVPTGTQPANLLEELLYEKRYSLLYEFGHRWVDLTRYHMLCRPDDTTPTCVSYGTLAVTPSTGLIKDVATTHRIWPSLPFDEGECNFRRSENLTGCPVGGEGGI